MKDDDDIFSEDSTDNFGDFISPDELRDEKLKKKQKKSSGVLFLIFAAIIIILALVYSILKPFALQKNSSPRRPTPNTPAPNSNGVEKFVQNVFPKDFFSSFINNSSDYYIAQVYVTGTIQEANTTYNQKWILDTIQLLQDDPLNKGILLVVDSPGGTVYEADEVYLALRAYKKTGKKLWAYMESMAASGGYYISCAADNILANRNTLTGSIGVIFGSSIDVTDFLNKMGIKSRTFSSGRNKNMLNYNQPLTEEQEQIMQSITDECYEQFTRIVAGSRKIPIKTIREQIADGRLYTASQAVELHLIDGICSLDDAKEKMIKEVSKDFSKDFDKTSEECPLTIQEFSYEYTSNIFERLSNIITGIKSPSTFFSTLFDFFGIQNAKSALIQGPAYLWQ